MSLLRAGNINDKIESLRTLNGEANIKKRLQEIYAAITSDVDSKVLQTTLLEVLHEKASTWSDDCKQEWVLCMTKLKDITKLKGIQPLPMAPAVQAVPATPAEEADALLEAEVAEFADIHS